MKKLTKNQRIADHINSLLVSDRFYTLAVDKLNVCTESENAQCISDVHTWNNAYNSALDCLVDCGIDVFWRTGDRPKI